MGKIRDGAEVQAVAASAILVLVNLVALHLADGANRIVELARVDVRVVCLHVLEREEVSILRDRQLASLKEVIQLIHGPLGRILHEVAEEVEQRLERQVLLHEVDDALGQRVVDRLAVEHDDAVFDLHVAAVNVVTHFAGEVNEVEELRPILVTNSLKNVLIVGVVGVHGIDRAIDDSGDFSATSDRNCCGVVIHTMLMLVGVSVNVKPLFFKSLGES